MRFLLLLVLWFGLATAQNSDFVAPEGYSSCYQIDGFSFHYAQDYACFDVFGQLVFSTPNDALLLGTRINDWFPAVIEQAYILCIDNGFDCSDEPKLEYFDLDSGLSGAFISFEASFFGSELFEFRTLSLDLSEALGNVETVLFEAKTDPLFQDTSDVYKLFLELLLIEYHDAVG